MRVTRVLLYVLVIAVVAVVVVGAVSVLSARPELNDAKHAFLESQKVGRTGDAALAGQIITNLNLNRKFAHSAEMEKKIADLWIDAKVARCERNDLAVLEDARGSVFWVERLREGGACRGAMKEPLRFEIETEMDDLR